jgi:hypothetical protein
MKKAAELAGRPIEVHKLADGQLVVEYMRFDRPPPRRGKTVEEALNVFIEDMTAYKATPQGQIEDKLNAEEPAAQ